MLRLFFLVTMILASLNKQQQASPAAPQAETPVDAPIENSQPVSAEPVVSQTVDVDTNPDIHVIPGQMQAASGEVSNVDPSAETVLSSTESSLNQLRVKNDHQT